MDGGKIMELGEALMKIVVKLGDVVALAKRFREALGAAMAEVATEVRAVVADTLERVMNAEIDLVLGAAADTENKRNGYRERSFAIKGISPYAEAPAQLGAARQPTAVSPRARGAPRDEQPEAAGRG